MKFLGFILVALVVAVLLQTISDTFGCGWAGGLAAGIVYARMFPWEPADA